MAHKVVWTSSAKADLRHLIAWVKKTRPMAAKKIYLEIRRRCRILENAALVGRVIPELGEKGLTHYRELVHPSWRIFYRVTQNKVRILAVMDSRRDAPSFLRERGLMDDR